MPNKLFLRPVEPLQQQPPQFEWALYDLSEQQVKYGAQSDLASIDQTLMQNGIAHVEVIVLWPAYAAFSSQISLPGNQSRFLQQALPFAVEEHLAQEVEQIHIAHGAKSKGSKFAVVSLDRAVFEPYFTLLTDPENSHPLKAVVLDAELLPLGEHDMVVCVAAGQALIKNKDQSSISLQIDNLFPYLDSVFKDRPDTQDLSATRFSIKVYIEAAEQEAATLLLAQMQQYAGVDLDSEVLGISGFELLCENYFRQALSAVNLCQGEFRKVSEQNTQWRKWRSVAIIAGVGFLLQLGVFVGKGFWFEKQAAEIGQNALAEYQKLVPDSKGVSVDKLPRIIKGQLNQKNSQANSELGFLELLGEAGYQFKEAKDKVNLEFASINYNQQRGELVLEMRANSFEQLEQLKQAIVDAGLMAKISSAVQEDNRFRGRISVTGS